MSRSKVNALLAFILVTLLAGLLITGPSLAAHSQPLPRKLYIPLVLRTSSSTAVGISNPGFELPATGWGYLPSEGQVRSSLRRRSGVYSAGLGNGEIFRNASISQTVTVPAGQRTLQYWQFVISDEYCGEDVLWDYVTVTVGGVKVAEYPVCESSPQSTWHMNQVNLSSFAGQTVALRVEFASDGSFPSTLYIDDFSFVSP